METIKLEIERLNERLAKRLERSYDRPGVRSRDCLEGGVIPSLFIYGR